MHRPRESFAFERIARRTPPRLGLLLAIALVGAWFGLMTFALVVEPMRHVAVPLAERDA
ncbi:MAG: hypothetical protein R3F55_10530 [Alphaproteobacteria bacterium]